MQRIILTGMLVLLVMGGLALILLPIAEDRSELTALASPAGPGSEEPSLTVAQDGRVYMSWIEAVAPEGHALRFASRPAGGEWSAPQTIASGTDWFVSYADYPSILALPDGALAAHWLVNAADPYLEAYHLNISISRDQGKTWSAPIIPYTDRSESQHGLVSLAATPEGRIGVIWLDGRNYAGAAEDGEVGMRYATVGLDGSVTPEIELDRRVCECCQTSTALTPEGLLVAYRDRSAEEVRDISIVRLKNGRWFEPKSVSADNWELYACPINGPAISAQARNVVVAWFTAPGDQPAVKAAFSGDGGLTFGNAVRIDEGNPVGRVDALMLPSGKAVISWLEGGEIRVRRVSPDGSSDAPMVVGKGNGFPQMERSGSEVVIAWTEPGEPSSVRTAILRLN